MLMAYSATREESRPPADAYRRRSPGKPITLLFKLRSKFPLSLFFARVLWLERRTSRVALRAVTVSFAIAYRPLALRAGLERLFSPPLILALPTFRISTDDAT
jgi:hypothetical protein